MLFQPGEYEVAMQSRTGCAEWTQPYFIPVRIWLWFLAAILHISIVVTGTPSDVANGLLRTAFSICPIILY